MSTNRYHAEIDLGTDDAGVIRFRLQQDADADNQPPFEERIGRQFYQSHGIIASGFDGVQSRLDERTWYQDSWEQGALWDRPRFQGEIRQAHYRSRNMNGSYQAGNMYPSNVLRVNPDRVGFPHTLGANMYIAVHPKFLLTMTGRKSPQPDIGLVSGAAVWRLGADSGDWEEIHTQASPDLKDEECYAVMTVSRGTGLSETFWLFENHIHSWNFLPTAPQFAGTFKTYPTRAPTLPEPAGFGSNLMRTVDGKLIYYSGNRFWEFDDGRFDRFSLTAYRTPFDDDGLGPDFLFRGITTSVLAAPATRCAVSTPQGIYYVKNVVESGGLPMAHIYRLNRTSTGIFTRQPVALLPVGQAATSIHWHAGSLLVMATEDYDEFFAQESETIKSTLWQVSPSTVVSEVGTIDGRSGDINSFELTGLRNASRGDSRVVPYILGSEGSFVYMGGRNSIWRFDGNYGNIEEVFYSQDWDAQGRATGIHQFARFLDNERPSRVFVGFRGTIGRVFNEQHTIDLEPSTVTSVDDPHRDFTDAENQCYVISLPFDFEIPQEVKYLFGVEIVTDMIDDGQVAILVSVRVDADAQSLDDKGWTHIGWHTAGTRSFFPVSITGTQQDERLAGDQFQVRLSYIALKSTVSLKPGERIGIRSIMCKSTTGRMMRQFFCTAQGPFTNLQNRQVQIEEVYRMWQEAAKVGRPIVFRHYLADRRKLRKVEYADVRIDQVSVRRHEDTFDQIRLVLTEITDANLNEGRSIFATR